MSVEKVKEFFKQYNIDNNILEFKVSSATVELAAQAIGCEPKKIAKTMAFIIEKTPIVVVTSGDAKISNSKYKEKFGVKAKMIEPDSLDAMIGHEMGGVCPFALKEEVVVYLDESLKRFKSVFPAAGSSNSVIELTLSELEKYSNYKEWVDVCKELE